MSVVNETTLFLFGFSHHTAPLEVREKIALSPESITMLYRNLSQHPACSECLILNTCNRVELYGVSADTAFREVVESQFFAQQKVNANQLQPHAYWKTNEAVIQHLFQVTAGLDSQMVGETEILGQVKTTFGTALEQHALGPVLNRVFQKSFQAAKWARTHTGIGRGQVSIGNVVSELAMRICGDLATSTILTMGSGDVGAQTTQALFSRGGRNTTIANRNLDKAHLLADQFKGAAMRLHDVPDTLHQFDIVIGCTAAPAPILTVQAVEQAMHKRATRPLFIIDLAIPRDVEPAVNHVSNVYLYNMDHLAKIANENLQARIAERESCRVTLFEKAAHVWQAVQKHEESYPCKES